MVRKLHPVSSRRALDFGYAVARRRRVTRTVSPRFDLIVLGGALRADRHWNRRKWSALPAAVGLLLRHVVREVACLGRHPTYVSRFLPSPVRALLRLVVNPVDRKIFRLRNYRPRAPRIPPAYFRTRPPADPPLISLVTPNFNGGAFLEETIKSVLGQQYPRLEYIVCDGGSTDESVSIVRRHEAQLAWWHSGPDRGQSHAVNLGMESARGEILAYLNSDDLLLPGCLSYVANYFREHPEIEVVYGHRLLVDAQGREIGRWVLPPHDEDAICFDDYVPQETLFWRRSAWKRVGGRIDESFQFAMDWDLILRFRAAGLKFARLPRFLGAFRVTEEQKSVRLIQTVGRREMDRLRLRSLGYMPKPEEIRHALRRYVARHWLLDKLYALGLVKY